jgi:hypothetical protein
MYLDKNYKFSLAFFFTLIAIFVPLMSKAYPKTEYESCLISATKSIKDNGIKASKEAIAKYCDCALTKIIDNNQDSDSSIYSCNQKHIF